MGNLNKRSSEQQFYRQVSALYRALITFFIFCALLSIYVLSTYDV